MKWLDLFSGVGMYALGLEQAGHEVIGFCERDDWCRRILKKNWPTKPSSSCVKSLTRALMPLLAAGRAKILALRESAPEWTGSALAYGDTYLEPFAWYDQKSQLWKTWQRCLVSEWAEFSGIWPASGMIRNGIAYQLPLSDFHTKGKGSGLWPTPQASDGPKLYRISYDNATKRQKDGRQLHWIHRAVLMQGQEGKWTANPRFAEEMMGLPKDFTELGTAIPH